MGGSALGHRLLDLNSRNIFFIFGVNLTNSPAVNVGEL